MKRISATQYKEGIASRNHFMQMLHDALKEALNLNDTDLREETSFSWQGYQIEKYPGLKDSQYYCQIYQESPNILAFHEYYEMSPHPFQAEIDLMAHSFFTLPYEQQKQMLIDFIKKACDESVKWNSSQTRREIVPERFW